MMPPIRTIASRWASFDLEALSENADRDERRIARIGFYSGALAMLEMLGTVPPGEADAVVRMLKAELSDFHAEIKKGPPR